jgi:alkanesulfonate monooxygenase SsuD/methylene tetrahydromethanopterin reductase-like flavin-dependent oxidoreductase (luciferase family)
MLTCATFRLPGLLAVEVAQVDDMSGGRVELGLGAGWFEGEHTAYGVPFPDTIERFDRLEEQLEIVTGMWATPDGEPYDFAGRHYTLRDCPAKPRPVQQPRPPVWVGGSAPAAVRRAARLADGWLPQGTPLDQMPALVEVYRRERGDDGGDIGAISEWLYVGTPSWDVGRPCTSGSAEQLAEALRRWSAVGVNHLQVRFPSRDVNELVAQVEAFGAEVGPLLGS